MAGHLRGNRKAGLNHKVSKNSKKGNGTLSYSKNLIFV